MLSLVFVCLPLVSWLAAIVLLSAAFMPPRVTALVERAIGAVLSAVASSLIGLLAIDYLTPGLTFERGVTTGLMLIALLVFSAPAVIFLVLYVTGRFGSRGAP